MWFLLYALTVCVAWFGAMTGGSPKVAVVVTLLPPLGIFAFRRPPFFLAMCLLIGAWNYGLGGGLLFLTFYKLSLIALVARAALDWYMRGGVERPAAWFYVAIVVLMIIVLVSGTLESSPRTVNEVFGLGSYVILGLCGRLFLRSRRDLMDLAMGLSMATVIVGGLAYMQTGFASLQAKQMFRAKILGMDPNEITTMLLGWVLIGLPVCMMRGVHWARRLLAFAAVPAFIYVMYVTASRGATVSAAVGFATFAILVPRTLKARLMSAAAFVVAVSAVTSVAPESYRYRMTSTLEYSEGGGKATFNDAHRTELAIESLKLIAERPFSGHGTSMSSIRNVKVLGRGMATHSMPLRVAESYGLFTLALVMALLLGAGLLSLTFIRQTSSPHVAMQCAGIVAALVACTVSSAGLTTMFPRPVWFALALISALHRNSLILWGTQRQRRPLRPSDAPQMTQEAQATGGEVAM